MILENQVEAIKKLEQLAISDRHSILISGDAGSGKSYLSKEYSKIKGIKDYIVIEPKVSSIRDSIINCLSLQNKIIISIENLDLGILSASYTLLKFLEEPPENIYIVITCRNIKNIPDTILSRCVTVSLPNMSQHDITEYAKQNYPDKLNVLNDIVLKRCLKSIADVDSIMKIEQKNIEHLRNIVGILYSNDCVSNKIWKLQKYPDGSPIDPVLAVRYIMYSMNLPDVSRVCIECLDNLTFSSIGTHAVLSKFMMQIKYKLQF